MSLTGVIILIRILGSIRDCNGLQSEAAAGRQSAAHRGRAKDTESEMEAKPVSIVRCALFPRILLLLLSYIHSVVTDALAGFTFTAWDDDGLLKTDDFLVRCVHFIIESISFLTLSLSAQGTFNISIDSLPRNVQVEHWFPVHKTEKYPKPITGEILVRFLYEVR